MKKISTFFLAIFAVMAVNAELIWHESFDRPLGNVDNGGCAAAVYTDQPAIMPTDDYANWWAFNSNSKKANPTEVVAGSLAWPSYAASPASGKIELTYGVTTIAGMTGNTFSRRVLRQIEPVSTGKVYYAAIIQVDSMSASVTANTILSFGDAGKSNTYAQLRAGRCTKTSDYYRLTIAKKDEYSYNDSTIGLQKLWSQPLALKTPHLVVVEYEFVDGIKNDICRVYVDPEIGTTECDVITQGLYTKANGMASGANQKDDASEIKSVNVLSASTYISAFVDEIKVATTWDDLFEAGESALIKANKSEVVKYIPAGGSFADSVVVTVENASAGDLLTAQSQDLNSIILVDDEAFDGIDASDARLTTGLTVHFWSDPEMPVSESGSDVLEIACGSATKEIAVDWVVLPTISSLADVNDSVIYTGNAQVTYKANGIITLQDDNGAIAVNALAGFEVGDVVTNLILLDSVAAYTRGEHSKLVYNVVSAEHSSVAYEATPISVRIADIDWTEHMNMLVQLDTVSLADSYGDVGTFSSLTYGRNRATKGGKSIYVVTPAGNTLVGESMYALANVVGVINAFPENTVMPDAAIVVTINPRGVEDVEEVLIPTLSFSAKTVKIEATMCVDSAYTSTLSLRGSHLVSDSTVVLEANGVTLGAYTLAADSVNKGALVTITIAPTEVDPNWKGTVYAYYNAPRYKMLVDSVVLNGKVDAPTLSFSVDTVKMDTMYVDSVYNTTVELTGTNLQLLYPTNVVTLSADGVAVELDEVTVDSISKGAIVAITITPSEANAEWKGSVVASYGNVTATVVLTGVVKNNTVIPSGMDAVGTKTRTMKVVRDGQVRIVRGENEFTVLGEQVK